MKTLCSLYNLLVAIALIAGLCCFACGSEDGTAEDDTHNPCALKGDRPYWCDNDVATEEDANAPPLTCGDSVCQYTEEYGEDCDNCPQDCGACEEECGDGICRPEYFMEDCDSCPEDCGCEFGFSCSLTGKWPAPDDNWDKYECKDDPFYELKLVLPGTYLRLNNGLDADYELCKSEEEYGCDKAAFGCDGILFYLANQPLCADSQLTLSICKDGANSGAECTYASPENGRIWFDCDLLANDFGEQVKNWCEALGHDFHCSEETGQCGIHGIRVERCTGNWIPGCSQKPSSGQGFVKQLLPN